MNTFNALGYGGKRAAFFQKFWKIVGPLTIEATLSLRSGYLLKEMNKTLIALIPEKKDPSDVFDFRLSFSSYKMAK
ncbi:hypothetical protein CCACVL1_17849 [Corchorus capsularis]|uniref:Uncharacterized protein n=1 Tax=Corchorus capsularis TaxID=210143 RepID=A0A1R3HPU8_COCAP|nr:hypothetical protein CCACVL1_17849 [Corchorus capsularis]